MILRDNNMNKRKFLRSKSMAAIAKVVATLTALLILAPVIQNLNAVRSSEVDALLYKYLDQYNNAIRDEPGVAELIVSAEKNPDALTEENRRKYISYQRKFFDEWEVAWTYYNAGQLDSDRWEMWNSWFVAEAMRRPQFGWVQNRMHYSGYFLLHVDEAIGEPNRGSKIAGTSQIVSGGR